jgi:putative transposase
MVQRAFRYRFYPTPEQAVTLNRTFGCVRLIYNKALDARTSSWHAEHRRVTYRQTSAMLTTWKQSDEFAFLNEVSSVRIDAGLTALVTLSTGEKVANPRAERRDRVRLVKAQRTLSRRQKGSNNSSKARLGVARIHVRITDRRRDHLHKLTTRLVRENQTIVIEDLNVRGMAGNRSLARAIGDAGWSELRRMLEYKCTWYGRDLVVVDRWLPSSKTCSACGYLVDRLPLSVREWTCQRCGAWHDRDVNAARNILAAGRAVTACGAGIRPQRDPSWRGDWQ